MWSGWNGLTKASRAFLQFGDVDNTRWIIQRGGGANGHGENGDDRSELHDEWIQKKRRANQVNFQWEVTGWEIIILVCDRESAPIPFDLITEVRNYKL